MTAEIIYGIDFHSKPTQERAELEMASEALFGVCVHRVSLENGEITFTKIPLEDIWLTAEDSA